jgi:hypothetical protein
MRRQDMSAGMSVPPGRGGTAVPVTESGAEVVRALLKAVEGIRYGSVELIIHDGKVVQIDRREKVRLDKCESCPKR